MSLLDCQSHKMTSDDSCSLEKFILGFCWAESFIIKVFNNQLLSMLSLLSNPHFTPPRHQIFIWIFICSIYDLALKVFFSFLLIITIMVFSYVIYSARLFKRKKEERHFFLKTINGWKHFQVTSPPPPAPFLILFSFFSFSNHFLNFYLPFCGLFFVIFARKKNRKKKKTIGSSKYPVCRKILSSSCEKKNKTKQKQTKKERKKTFTKF